MQSLGLGRTQILRDVSFTLKRGEWIVLMGANGSGKSTLARIANGLLLPSEGELIADGISSWQHARLLELRQCVGLVTQDPDNQIVSTSVFDEIAFGPQNLGWEPERIYAAVSDALARVGLSEEEFAKRDPGSLSGGERQRVVVAAILAMLPNYLVLDEPTSLLDPLARAQILETVAYAAKSGQGILYTTHILKEASFADRLLVLDHGSIVYDGVPEELLRDGEALRAYGLVATPKRKIAKQGDGPFASDLKQKDRPPASLTLPKLTLEKVSYSYPDDTRKAPILTDIGCELSAGECLLLVGPSGSGKSTLLSIAAGLLEPTSGKVSLWGNTSGKAGKAPYPGQIGLVFQQPETQLFAQTIADDILFGPKNLGLLDKPGKKDKKSRKKRKKSRKARKNKYSIESTADTELITEVLKAVGLSPVRFMDRSPFSLSGGEAQRAAIATTLALKTDFLLLDEPTAGLDAEGKVFVYELIQDLLAEGKGVAIATHDPGFFAPLATSRMDLV